MLAELEKQRSALLSQIPDNWESARDKFESFAKNASRARQAYRMNVDESYETIFTLRKKLAETAQLKAISEEIPLLIEDINNRSAEEAMEIIKSVESDIDALTEVHEVKSLLSKARRALRGTNPEPGEAIEFAWQQRAVDELSEDLKIYDNTIAHTIGMRMQTRLTRDQAESISDCLSVHRDLSLYF